MFEGFEVTPYYDSMIAKLICWGDSRGEAVMRLRRALSEFRIMGVKTNIPFHVKLVGSLRFQAGTESEIDSAAQAATNALNAVTGKEPPAFKDK